MPDEPDAAAGGRGRLGRWRLLGAGALGLVAMLSASGLLLFRVAEALVPRTRVEAIETRDHAPDAARGDGIGAAQPLTGVQNVLVVGIDSRAGLTDAEISAISAGRFNTELTDTLMWVQYDTRDGQLRIASFPRDLRVHPGGGNAVKLNALRALGGPDLLVSTIENMVGADFDHYVEVDLAGFLHLAEAVGGVRVCLDQPMIDWRSGLDLPAGCQQLNAAQTTGFVRARHVSDEFGAGTAGRSARQQYFIRQAVAEVVTAGTMTSPTRVRALLDLVRQSVVVDDAFSTPELLSFANAFRSFDADQIVGATVPFTSRRFAQDNLFYDELTPDADRLFAALRNAQPFPDDLITTGDAQTAMPVAGPSAAAAPNAAG